LPTLVTAWTVPRRDRTPHTHPAHAHPGQRRAVRRARRRRRAAARPDVRSAGLDLAASHAAWSCSRGRGSDRRYRSRSRRP